MPIRACGPSVLDQHHIRSFIVDPKRFPLKSNRLRVLLDTRVTQQDAQRKTDERLRVIGVQ
jgi:hypothetical protein